MTVGDSAISGEAGRWAGNTNKSSSKVDALGADAYYDNARDTAEQIPGCHRSKTAEAHIGGGVNSLNLACSGARTYTQTPAGDFKPGLDFYSDATAGKGQALMLQEFAATNNVKAVTVSSAPTTTASPTSCRQCVTNWLTSPSWWKNYCHDDSERLEPTSPRPSRPAPTNVRGALLNVRQAMLNAGYADAATRSSSRPTRRRSRAAARSATRSRAGRGSRPAVAASGTGTPTGRTTPRS